MDEIKENKQREFEQKAYRFSVLDSRLHELEQGLSLIERQINELQASQVAIDELVKAKPNTGMLAPLGPGTFINASIESTKEILIDLGAKVLCKKTPEEAKQIMQQRINQAILVHENLTCELQKIVQEMTGMEEELRQ